VEEKTVGKPLKMQPKDRKGEGKFLCSGARGGDGKGDTVDGNNTGEETLEQVWG